MSVETRPAFYTLFYTGDFSKAAEDAASLHTEALITEKPIDPDNVWYYDHFPPELSPTEKYFASTWAALDTERLVKETPENQKRIVVWVSPGYAYPENRVNIFLVTNDSGVITFEAYGIRHRESIKDVVGLLNRFRLLSDYPGIPFLENPTDIEMTPLSATFSENTNLYSTGRLYIALPAEIWNQVESGEIKERCRKKIEAMAPVSQILELANKNKINPYITGLQAEKIMMNIGGSIDLSGSGCGPSNGAFLGSSGQNGGDSHEHASCREIICPRCGWKPENKIRENEIRNKQLITCPDCNWPNARPDPVVPAYVTTQTPELVFYSSLSGDYSPGAWVLNFWRLLEKV